MTRKSYDFMYLRPAISIPIHPSIMVKDFSDLITVDIKSFLAIFPARRKFTRYG